MKTHKALLQNYLEIVKKIHAARKAGEEYGSLCDESQTVWEQMSEGQRMGAQYTIYSLLKTGELELLPGRT